MNESPLELPIFVEVLRTIFRKLLVLYLNRATMHTVDPTTGTSLALILASSSNRTRDTDLSVHYFSARDRSILF